MERYKRQWHNCSECEYLFSSELFHRLDACKLQHTHAHISTEDFYKHLLGLMQCQLNCLLLLLCRSAWSWIVGVAYTHVRLQTRREKRFCHDPFMFLLICNKCFLTHSSISIQSNPLQCIQVFTHFQGLLFFLSFSIWIETITIHKYTQVKENYQLRNASSALHWIVSNECLKYINIDSNVARTPTMKRKIEKSTWQCDHGMCVCMWIAWMDGYTRSQSGIMK